MVCAASSPLSRAINIPLPVNGSINDAASPMASSPAAGTSFLRPKPSRATASQPARGASAGKRLRCPAVFHQDFTHHSSGIAPARAHVARLSDEAKIAQAIFDTAQTAIAAAIKIDFAMAVNAARVFQMSFESNERRASTTRSHDHSFSLLYRCGEPAHATCPSHQS